MTTDVYIIYMFTSLTCAAFGRRGYLSEEDVSRREVGGHAGAVFPQRGGDGGVHQLQVLAVVVLQRDGRRQLLRVFAQQQSRRHGRRARRGRGEPVQEPGLRERQGGRRRR